MLFRSSGDCRSGDDGGERSKQDDVRPITADARQAAISPPQPLGHNEPGSLPVHTSPQPVSSASPRPSAAPSLPTLSEPTHKTRFVHLRGINTEFRTLVEYLQKEMSMGIDRITVQTLSQHLGSEIEGVIQNATSRGFVETVSDSVGPKITLPPHIGFIF